MWWILGLIAAAGLALNFRGPNAVWGTATLALVVGVIVALVAGWPFWATLGKAVVIGALVGVVFQFLQRLAGNSSRKPAEWDHVD